QYAGTSLPLFCVDLAIESAVRISHPGQQTAVDGKHMPIDEAPRARGQVSDCRSNVVGLRPPPQWHRGMKKIIELFPLLQGLGEPGFYKAGSQRIAGNALFSVLYRYRPRKRSQCRFAGRVGGDARHAGQRCDGRHENDAPTALFYHVWQDRTCAIECAVYVYIE